MVGTTSCAKTTLKEMGYQVNLTNTIMVFKQRPGLQGGEVANMEKGGQGTEL